MKKIKIKIKWFGYKKVKARFFLRLMELTRVIIYPKDVQRITGKSERYCRAILAKIKAARSKANHQFVSIQEFSDYSGISVDLISKYLVD